MAERILVPVDGSEPAAAALEYAHEHFPEDRLTVLYVVDPMADYSRERSYPGYTADDEFKTEHEKGEAILENARERLPGDATIETALEAGKPPRVIVEYADDHDVDGIVIGSHGRTGAVRYLLGSVAEQVVRRAAVPVTIVRGTPDDEG